MEGNVNTYIKADNNIVINEKSVIWIKKMGECLSVCTNSKGCFRDGSYMDTHKICKSNTPDSYDKLNPLFKTTDS